MASSKKHQCADLADHFASFIQRHIPPGSRLLLGLSGGLDSCVLLDLLAQAGARSDFFIAALHVNHGISPNAGRWSDFCAALCASANVPFKAVKVDVARDSGLGLEAAAREARYAALLAEPADFVMLAHHRDDQAETLLLQLLRGAGLKGLAAMGGISCPPRGLPAGRPPRGFPSGHQRSAVPQGDLLRGVPQGDFLWGISDQPKPIMRPLLDVPRATLLEYAEAHGLKWIEDESNLDLAYDRNFLRHRIFPELEQRFPASRATLARSAAHLAEAAGLLEELAVADAGASMRHDSLDLAVLQRLSPARARNLLRCWLSQAGVAAPPSVRLEEMLRQLLCARADAQVRFRMGAHELRRYRDCAWLVGRRCAVLVDMSLAWCGEESLRLEGLGTLEFHAATGSGINLEKLAGSKVAIRLRRGGERFKPDCARPTRNLKSLLQESGVPPWQRERLPLVYCGEVLIAVPDVGIACDWQARTGETGVRLDWNPAG